MGNQTLTYAPQIHIAVVEIDKNTCQPKILDYAVVDDCGVAINPKIVEGQVHGAVCHGIGAAMQEAFQFDEGGNLITATFTDYALHAQGVIITESHNSPSIIMEAVAAQNRDQIVSVSHK
jgi:CO/xanthine dehydrogenase Mo-binding subunit